VSTPVAGPPVAPGEHTGALEDLAGRILAQALPGEQLEVVISQEVATEVRVHGGDVESLSVADAAGVGIRVVADQRQGLAHCGTLDADAVAATLAEARDNVRYASPDPWAGLAEPDGVSPPVLDLLDARVVDTPLEDKVDLALALEEATLAADGRIRALESTEYADSVATSVVASTTGIHSVAREGVCWVSVEAMAGDADATQTGFGYALGRHPGALAVGDAAGDAARRATRMLGATQPRSMRTTLVLDPWVTAQLLEVVGDTLSGEAVVKGRSPFANRLGERIAAPEVTLTDDPTCPEAFSASAFDGEGLATRRNLLVANGQLEMFVHNAASARRAGTASTGSAVRRGYGGVPGVGCVALGLTPGTATPEELMAAVPDGIWVVDVTGLHSGTNPVSGDLSVGAEGLRITGGTVGEPLREFTIASTLQRLLTGVTAVGSDLTWLPMGASGVTVVVSDVTVSGS